jgi:hypothetical protein
MEIRATYYRRCNRPVCPECKREEQARGRRVGEQESRRTADRRLREF